MKISLEVLRTISRISRRGMTRTLMGRRQAHADVRLQFPESSQTAVNVFADPQRRSRLQQDYGVGGTARGLLPLFGRMTHGWPNRNLVGRERERPHERDLGARSS